MIFIPVSVRSKSLPSSPICIVPSAFLVIIASPSTRIPSSTICILSPVILIFPSPVPTSTFPSDVVIFSLRTVPSQFDVKSVISVIVSL